MSETQFGLPQELIDEIIKRVVSFKPVKKILIYGSRATGDYKRTSDIDIAIVASNWDSSDIGHIHGELEEEVFTSLKFDVTHYNRISNIALKNDIDVEGVLIYESKKN